MRRQRRREVAEVAADLRSRPRRRGRSSRSGSCPAGRGRRRDRGAALGPMTWPADGAGDGARGPARADGGRGAGGGDARPEGPAGAGRRRGAGRETGGDRGRLRSSAAPRRNRAARQGRVVEERGCRSSCGSVSMRDANGRASASVDVTCGPFGTGRSARRRPRRSAALGDQGQDDVDVVAADDALVLRPDDPVAVDDEDPRHRPRRPTARRRRPRPPPGRSGRAASSVPSSTGRVGHDRVAIRLVVDERDVAPAVEQVAGHDDRPAARRRDLEPDGVDDEHERLAGGQGVGGRRRGQPQVGRRVGRDRRSGRRRRRRSGRASGWSAPARRAQPCVPGSRAVERDRCRRGARRPGAVPRPPASTRPAAGMVEGGDVRDGRRRRAAGPATASTGGPTGVAAVTERAWTVDAQARVVEAGRRSADSVRMTGLGAAGPDRSRDDLDGQSVAGRRPIGPVGGGWGGAVAAVGAASRSARSRSPRPRAGPPSSPPTSSRTGSAPAAAPPRRPGRRRRCGTSSRRRASPVSTRA